MRVCPGCNNEINEDDPVEKVGRKQFHLGCYEELEEEMENANLLDE